MHEVLRQIQYKQNGVYKCDYIKEEERLMVNVEIYLEREKLQDQFTDLLLMTSCQIATSKGTKRNFWGANGFI